MDKFIDEEDPSAYDSYVIGTTQLFAGAMIDRLLSFQGEPGKRGWLSDTNGSMFLMDRAVARIQRFLQRCLDRMDTHLPVDHAAEIKDTLDIANYMMMIHDRSTHGLD